MRGLHNLDDFNQTQDYQIYIYIYVPLRVGSRIYVKWLTAKLWNMKAVGVLFNRIFLHATQLCAWLSHTNANTLWDLNIGDSWVKPKVSQQRRSVQYGEETERTVLIVYKKTEF